MTKKAWHASNKVNHTNKDLGLLTHPHLYDGLLSLHKSQEHAVLRMEWRCEQFGEDIGSHIKSRDPMCSEIQSV